MMQVHNETEKRQSKIFTVPNVLSLFRICLIPVFVWLYCVENAYVLTGCILLLSGLTDIVDGFVARRFNLVSDLGKILDPIADKVTQTSMIFCLLTRFPMMIVPLALMIVKEFFLGITGYMVIQKTGEVYGANWHGKVNTCLLYAMMVIHVVWYDIGTVLSTLSIGVCVAMMIVSLILYGKGNMDVLNKQEKEETNSQIVDINS